MAATKKQCFLVFSSPTVVKSPGFKNDYKFSIRVNSYQ